MLYSFQNIYYNFIRLLVLPGVFFLIVSCENDIQKIQSLAELEMPDLSGENAEIIYTDSSRLQLKLSTPSLKQYSKADRPYIEFPEGIYVEFYDDSTQIETIISANHAFYFTEEKFWEAKGNVVVNNLFKGEKLNSEELFWNETEKIIYSNSYSRIETTDGTFYGQNGFESNERFSRWKLKGSKGTVNFKEKEDEE